MKRMTTGDPYVKLRVFTRTDVVTIGDAVLDAVTEDPDLAPQKFGPEPCKLNLEQAKSGPPAGRGGALAEPPAGPGGATFAPGAPMRLPGRLLPARQHMGPRERQGRAGAVSGRRGPRIGDPTWHLARKWIETRRSMC